MNSSYTITVWREYDDPDVYGVKHLTWDDLVALLSTHLKVVNKLQTPLFSPFEVHAPAAPCTRHKGPPRTHPHRCNACVSSISLLVFDADCGTEEDMIACDEALGAANITRHWYSTYSHHPVKPSFRLVVPVTHPIAASAYKALRKDFITRYKVPADASKCGGLSHQYFLPSVNDRAPAEAAVVSTSLGHAFNTLPYSTVAHPGASSAPPPTAPLSSTWRPPSVDPGAVLNLTRAREAVKHRLFVAKRRVKEADKAGYLAALLAGEPLANHGNRDHATTVTCGMLAYALPGEPVELLMELIRPSLYAMMAAGSKLTEEKVLTKFESAMRAKASHDHDVAAATARARYKMRHNLPLAVRQEIEAEAAKYGVGVPAESPLKV